MTPPSGSYHGLTRRAAQPIAWRVLALRARLAEGKQDTSAGTGSQRTGREHEEDRQQKAHRRAATRLRARN